MLLQVLSLARTALKFRKSKTTSPDVSKPKPRDRLANLRLFAILPVLCTAIALLLVVLCVFAGHKPGMMEDYAVFTLNTSRLGENVLQELDAKISSVHLKRSLAVTLSHTTVTTVPVITAAPTTLTTLDPRGLASDITSLESKASSVLKSATSVIRGEATSIKSVVAGAATSALGAAETDIVNVVNKAYEGLIADLNLKDFYSIYMSASCVGTYEFQNGTNVTVGDSGLPAAKGKDSVHKHVESCSPHSALDPMSLIRILYWVGIVFTGSALAAGVAGIVLLRTRGRKMALINVFITLPAFCFVGLASAVTHGLSLGAAKLINFIGADVGVAGYMGHRFLALTWATTVLLLVNMAFWSLLFFLSGRSDTVMGLLEKSRGGRPDRTSTVAMLPISRPMPVYDNHGVQMI